jgi:hypothetical protein
VAKNFPDEVEALVPHHERYDCICFLDHTQYVKFLKDLRSAGITSLGDIGYLAVCVNPDHVGYFKHLRDIVKVCVTRREVTRLVYEALLEQREGKH